MQYENNIDEQLETIMDRHTSGVQYGGMAGAFQLFEGLNSAGFYKRGAAKNLKRIRDLRSWFLENRGHAPSSETINRMLKDVSYCIRKARTA